MKKSNPHAIILKILIPILFISCSKTSSSQDESFDDKEDKTEYVFIDNLEDKIEWNSAIIGKNGLSYFYNFKNGTSNKFSIFDNNKKNLLIYAEFDEHGRPSYIVSGDYTYVLDNYKDNTFDLAVALKNEVVCIINNIPIEEQLNRLFTDDAYTRSYSAKDDARKTNAVISGIGCAASGALAIVSGGLSTPLAFISCTSALITIVDASCIGCCPPWLTTLSTVIGCVDGIGCTVSILGEWMSLSAEAIDLKNIQIAKNALSIDVNTELKDVEVDYAKILLPVIHNMKSSYIEQSDIEIGIFYSTNPGLPETDRIREKDEKLNWLTLLNGDCIGSIELNNLKPNTRYYYKSYLIYNMAIACGEIKSFTTAGIYTGGYFKNADNEVICLGKVYSYQQKPNEFGLCYSTTNTNPTLQDTYVSYQPSINMDNEYEYPTILSNIKSNITYYYRAYMKMGDKIYYGTTKSFLIKEEEETDADKLVGTWIPKEYNWWWKEINEKGEAEIHHGNITEIIDRLVLNSNGTCNSSAIFGKWEVIANYLLISYHFYNDYAQTPHEPESALPLHISSLSKNEWIGTYEDLDDDRHEYLEIRFIREE